MPGEALRPEDVQVSVQVSVDPNEPTLFRLRVLLREETDPALVEFLQAHSVTQEAVQTETVVTPPEPVERHWAPPSSPVKEARLGPLEIKLDLGPFMKIVERLHAGYQHLVEKLAGPELMQIIEDITEHRRKPVTDFEHMIAKTLLGPTRFDRINEDD
jgi:hypothetical protein